MALTRPESVPLAIAAHAAVYGAWRTVLSWADRRWPLPPEPPPPTDGG